MADDAIAASAAAAGVRTPENSPDFTRSEVTDFEAQRKRCRDLFAGTDAMHENASTYLPAWPGEDTDTYRVRSTITELYNGFGRCVVASEGLVFAKPPQLEDGANAEIVGHWDDIDGMGTAARVFLRDLFRQGLMDGLPAILVDYPKVENSDRVSEADRQEKNLRPRWIPITTDQIRNWRIGKINNRIELTLVAIQECVDEDAGEFGVAQVEQMRVLRLGLVFDENGVRAVPQVSFKVWRKEETKTSDGVVIVWKVHEEGLIKPVTSIPLAVGYIGVRQGPMVATPPLLDLADLNLGHYRVSADRRWLMSICHAPTPVIEKYTDPVNPDGTPRPEEPMKLGPSSSLKLRGDATFSWKQADPEALTSSKEEKDDLIAQMASMSMAFLSQERKAQETATAHRINAQSQNATLGSAAIALEDMINQALGFHAQFMGVTPAPRVKVNVTYDESALDPSTISALNQLAAANNLTRKTLLIILQRGNVIPDDVNIEQEELELLTLAIEADERAREQRETEDNPPPPPSS